MPAMWTNDIAGMRLGLQEPFFRLSPLPLSVLVNALLHHSRGLLYKAFDSGSCKDERGHLELQGRIQTWLCDLGQIINPLEVLTVPRIEFTL